MMVYYLDSSAWVKRYFNERGSDWVDGLFEEGHLLSCSTLGLIEVTATAARKCAAGAIDAAGFTETKDWLLDEWGSFLWVGLMPEVVERCLKLADTFALRGSDSVHLASALQLRDDLAIDADEFALVTSDQELKSAALKAGLAVVDPQDQAEPPGRPTV
ncbi:MAG: type II toxin-antitoxin system VapC family toxin [Acidobacteria bacterium]|nr:type II toxin-antitoxin system VapC family toxin [Acidobacteriota bacterium]